jgi:hypothetical protein
MAQPMEGSTVYCSTIPAGGQGGRTTNTRVVAASLKTTAQSVAAKSQDSLSLTQQQQLWAACEDACDLLKGQGQAHGSHAEHQAPGDIGVVEPQEQRGVVEAHNSGQHHPPGKGGTAACLVRMRRLLGRALTAAKTSTPATTHKGKRFVRFLHSAPSFCSRGLNTTGLGLLASPPPPAGAALDLHTQDGACCCCSGCCCWCTCGTLRGH